MARPRWTPLAGPFSPPSPQRPRSLPVGRLTGCAGEAVWQPANRILRQRISIGGPTSGFLSSLGITRIILNSGLPSLASTNEVAGIGASAPAGGVASIDSSKRLIMTVVSRSLLLDSPSTSVSATVYPSDFWRSDRQPTFGKRRTIAADAVPNVGCAESSDRRAKINRETSAFAGPGSAGRRMRRFIVHCAISCVVCPAALSAGLVGGALIAQSQPISVLESGGFALGVPRFFTVEANAGQAGPQGLVVTAPGAFPKLAM